MLRNTTESLQAIYAPIHVDLERVESLLRDQFRSDFRFIDTLAGYGLRLAGKRLRPALVLLSGVACGAVTSDHHTMAVVVEMIHTATLVHDDVLDDSRMRRHTATLNTLFDNETAVLFGDYLLARAIRVAMDVNRDGIPSMLAETTQRIVEGELRQVGSRGESDLPESEYESIIRGKTAALCECCTRIGATLAGARADVVNALAEYAGALGMAFQVADDLLDLSGNESEAGKSLGTDLEKRKMTLPLIHLLREATPADRREINALLAEPTAETRQELRPWFGKYRSADYARWRAAGFIAAANEALDRAMAAGAAGDGECATAIEALRRLADFTVTRRH